MNQGVNHINQDVNHMLINDAVVMIYRSQIIVPNLFIEIDDYKIVEIDDLRRVHEKIGWLDGFIIAS